MLPCLSLTIPSNWHRIAFIQLLQLEMACQPIIFSYPGIVPSTFPKDFCLLPDCPLYISSVQSLSHAQLFSMSWGAARQSSLSITNSHSLLKLMFIKLLMPPNYFVFFLTLCLLPLIFPSIRVFSKGSVLPIKWPRYWRFSFSIGLSKEYSGMISFRMERLDLLADQGTCRSLFQNHSSKASVL